MSEKDNREAIFTTKQLQDAEARDHGGHGPVRRTLLLALTQSMDELESNIRKDPKLEEAIAEIAERSFDYFEWLDHDRDMLRCGRARLLVALGVVEPTSSGSYHE